MTSRRATLAWAGGAAGLLLLRDAAGAAAAAPLPPAPQKVLRYAFPIAESGFDPARVDDLYSRTVTSHLFEGLYRYDHLARPPRVRTLTAAGMPEVSSDFRTWAIRITPGIHFAADPAFKGVRRELTAADYVYSFKRFADPAVLSPAWTNLETFELAGLAALRKAAATSRQPFDYAREVPGVRALDRYTLQFRLDKPNPRFIDLLTGSDLFGAVAREVVEAYADDIPAHPVGTGPFRLAQWRRSSLIVLERNPDYRERFYDAEPAAADAEGQALLARLKGRRLPMIDRVEVSIVEESQPRWLSFLNGQADLIERVPAEFIDLAVPGGALAPNLARRGMQAFRMVAADSVMHYFNMEDPVVGGYTPDKVALRRAVNLATDLDREIRTVRHGQAVAAQSTVSPWTSGFDPGFRSENSEYSPPKARALLDLYGYVDRNRDGWRELPDGRPLLIEVATQPSQLDRQFDELWQRNLTAIGIRVRFGTAQWPENMKAARAGRLMVWGLGSNAAGPDGQDALSRLHGPQSGGQNLARFRLPAFDALYDRLSELPDGPEREAVFLQAKEIVVAYAPYKYHVHRIYNDIAAAGLQGYRRPVFWQDWWQYVDIDPAAAARGAR